MEKFFRYIPDFSFLTKYSKPFDFNIGKWQVSTSYLQAGAIVILLFILIITLAQVRRHYIDWSAKGTISGVAIGFVLALVLEGFLIISGRTALTELLGWKNPPKPISTALDAGKSKLNQVLGTSAQIPDALGMEKNLYQRLLSDYQSLSPQEADKIRSLICKP